MYSIFKRGFDILFASTLILLLSPVMIVIAVITRRSGPIFFRHKRISQGKSFDCLKFRTMIDMSQAEFDDMLVKYSLKDEWESTRKLKFDPRIIPGGNFIRKYSLDELPQLINVLKGDMSLIGPRPITLKELESYGENQRWYNLVKPGLSGLWQVSGRNSLSFEQRMNFDVYYASHLNLMLDATIFIKTPLCVLSPKDAY